jgi:hypothetical protein
VTDFSEKPARLPVMEQGQSPALRRKYRFIYWSIAIVVIVTLVLSHHRQQKQLTVAQAERESHARDDSAGESLAQLVEISVAVRGQPASTLRLLPSYARTLDSVVAVAEKAEAALDAGSLTEAAAQCQNAAETLSEFARVAKGVPQLASLAEQADGLAKQFDLLSIPSGDNTAVTRASPANPR